MTGIDAEERGKILKAHSFGPRMLLYLEEIGVMREGRFAA